MVGLGGLEPPTSPLSGARSSHLSYRPCQASEETAHNSLSLRCLSFVCNCVQIVKLRWLRIFGQRLAISCNPTPDQLAASHQFRSSTTSQGAVWKPLPLLRKTRFSAKWITSGLPTTRPESC